MNPFIVILPLLAIIGLGAAVYHVYKHADEYVGKVIKEFIETRIPKILGVPVEFNGVFNVDPLYGKAELRDITVRNPRGYTTEHFLHVDRVVADFDMWAILKSRAKKVEVQVLKLEGWHLNIEVHGGSSMSCNIKDIHDSMKQNKPPARKKTFFGGLEEGIKGLVKDGSSELEPLTEKEPPPPATHGPEIVLHDVQISNIQVGVVFPTSARTNNFPPGDFHEENFSQMHPELNTPSLVTRFILEKVVFSAFAKFNVFRKEQKDAETAARAKEQEERAERRISNGGMPPGMAKNPAMAKDRDCAPVGMAKDPAMAKDRPCACENPLAAMTGMFKPLSLPSMGSETRQMGM